MAIVGIDNPASATAADVAALPADAFAGATADDSAAMPDAMMRYGSRHDGRDAS